MKPTFTSDTFGEELLHSQELDVWGGQPGDRYLSAYMLIILLYNHCIRCTQASFFGCKRSGGADGTIINPIMSSRLRTAKSFTFKYGKVEARAKVSFF
jgi:hypothetical protein